MLLIDTDVLIAHLRGHDAARGWLNSARRDSGPLAVSAVTVAEILGGMRAPERHTRRLIQSLRRYAVTDAIAWQAGEFMRRYRRSHPGLGLGEYLIAATAEVEGFDLATLNVTHYPMFASLKPAFV